AGPTYPSYTADRAGLGLPRPHPDPGRPPESGACAPRFWLALAHGDPRSPRADHPRLAPPHRGSGDVDHAVRLRRLQRDQRTPPSGAPPLLCLLDLLGPGGPDPDLPR